MYYTFSFKADYELEPVSNDLQNHQKTNLKQVLADLFSLDKQNQK